MKFVLAIILVFSSFQVMAQNRKSSTPVNSATTYSSSSYSSSNSSGSGAVLTPGLWFNKGAISLSVQYEKPHESSTSLGGYFMLQQDKEKSGVKIVNQVLSFGGQLKAHLIQNAGVDWYVAPGFGLHMIKDVPDSSSSSGKSDVNAIGPTFRTGVLLPVSPAFSMGLDRLEVWNWFDDKAASSYVFYSAVVALSF